MPRIRLAVVSKFEMETPISPSGDRNRSAENNVMGVTAGLIRYPTHVYEDVKAAGSYYPPDGYDFEHLFLDRSWDELHPALRTFGPPLSLALTGDYGFDGGLDQFGWDSKSESDHYIAFVSPSLTQEISLLLSTLPFAELAAKFDEPSRGTDYLEPFFRKLVKFYASATASQNCLFIHVA